MFQWQRNAANTKIHFLRSQIISSCRKQLKHQSLCLYLSSLHPLPAFHAFLFYVTSNPFFRSYYLINWSNISIFQIVQLPDCSIRVKINQYIGLKNPVRINSPRKFFVSKQISLSVADGLQLVLRRRIKMVKPDQPWLLH